MKTQGFIEVFSCVREELIPLLIPISNLPTCVFSSLGDLLRVDPCVVLCNKKKCSSKLENQSFHESFSASSAARNRPYTAVWWWHQH